MPKPTPDHPMPWFCVRAQPGRQNVAAAHLRSFGVEVFNPHLLVRKATRQGVSWKSEPLFQNYLFARFDFVADHRRVHYGFGVSGLVRFGARYAEIADHEIEPLRQEWGASEARAVDAAIAPGDRVRLSGALFHGVEAEVLCLLPSRSRVKVLLEFLGGPKEAEVEASAIVPVLAHPLAFPA
jgi:transcription antitermination factor NusG